MSAASTPPRKLTGADVKAFIEELNTAQPASPDADPELRTSYRQAAAVLAAIGDPAKLRPLRGAEGKAGQILKDDLVTTPGKRQLGGQFMLRHEVRREALKTLGSRERMLEALDRNPGERNGPVQAKLEAYLTRKAAPLLQQNLAELPDTLQVVLWLEGIIDGLPPVEEVRRELGRSRFRAPFDVLAGDNFRGRQAELATLRSFVGVAPPESLLEALRRKVFEWTLLPRQPALTLYGPGGIGKSALVARFMREHIDLPETVRIPFAYLDFDSPFLNINDLGTLLVEIMRQLALQFPEATGIASILARVPPTVQSLDFSSALAGVLGILSLENRRPFLLVLDTFEEVQYGGEERAYPLWQAFDMLYSGWPALRIVISGRAPVTSLKLGGKAPDELLLAGLDQEAAVAYVLACGIDGQPLAQALVKQVGRVPLSLQLAASLVRQEGAGEKGVRNLKTTEYFLLSASDEVIQGQLYERILGHIHNPEVVKLAHPGLVLRRVTAEVIFEVLRVPCELRIATLEEARALFDELALETALVSVETDGALRHRQDLRRMMLTLLVQKNPAQTLAIHQGAVQFYQRQIGSTAAAERCYHLLMLGQLPDSVTLRDPEIRKSLQTSIPEMPVAVQTSLASLGYDVAREVLNQATIEQQESYTAAKIEELLPHGERALEEASKMSLDLSYRGKNSALYLAEARVLFLKRDLQASVATADEGLQYASQAGDTARVLDTLCLKAWILELQDRGEDLLAALEFVDEYAQRLRRSEELIQHRAQRLRLARRRQNEQDTVWAAGELASMLPALSHQRFLSMAPLLYDVFAPVTKISPEPLRKLAPLIAFGDLPADRLEPLLPYLEESMGQRIMKPYAQLEISDLRSSDLVHNGLVRILEQFKDDTRRLIQLADVIDSILQFWPVRLPYLKQREVA